MTGVSTSTTSTRSSPQRQILHRGGLLEYVETPVSLDEIGGLQRLKHWLAERQYATDDRAKEFG